MCCVQCKIHQTGAIPTNCQTSLQICQEPRAILSSLVSCRRHCTWQFHDHFFHRWYCLPNALLFRPIAEKTTKYKDTQRYGSNCCFRQYRSGFSIQFWRGAKWYCSVDDAPRFRPCISHAGPRMRLQPVFALEYSQEPRRYTYITPK